MKQGIQDLIALFSDSVGGFKHPAFRQGIVNTAIATGCIPKPATNDFVMYSEVRDCSRAVHAPPLSAFTVVDHVDIARLTVERMVNEERHQRADNADVEEEGTWSDDELESDCEDE
jgi:hypothetical protein